MPESQLFDVKCCVVNIQSGQQGSPMTTFVNCIKVVIQIVYLDYVKNLINTSIGTVPTYFMVLISS